MSTHEGFLAAICAEPDDETHRLIYADWLEEQGSTDLDAVRAELIRVQLAREATDPASEAWWGLRARERILLQTWGDALAAGVSEHAEDCRFRGGFVEALAMPVETLVERGPALRGLAPLRGVALAGMAESLNPEMLAPFQGLRIWNVLWTVDAPEEQAAYASVLWPRLLDVNAFWLGTLHAGLNHGWPLRHLGLGAVRVPGRQSLFSSTLHFEEDETLDLFARPIPESLVSLDLRGVQLTRAGWEWLLDLPWIHQIERLAFWADFEHRGHALGFLSRRPHLANLCSLWLGGEPGEHFREYGDALHGLKQLVVQGDGWFDPSRDHQPVQLDLPELTSLRQEYLTDGEELIGRLLQWDRWPALRVLEFRRWQSNYAEAMPTLLRAALLPRLRRLEVPALPETGFNTSLGEHALAELTVSATDLSTSLAAISRSTVLPNLVSLEIARARLDRPEDLEPLLDRSRFPRLQRIDVGGLDLDETWRRRFAARFGPGATFSSHPLTVFAVHDRILEGWL